MTSLKMGSTEFFNLRKYFTLEGKLVSNFVLVRHLKNIYSAKLKYKQRA